MLPYYLYYINCSFGVEPNFSRYCGYLSDYGKAIHDLFTGIASGNNYAWLPKCPPATTSKVDSHEGRTLPTGFK